MLSLSTSDKEIFHRWEKTTSRNGILGTYIRREDVAMASGIPSSYFNAYKAVAQKVDQVDLENSQHEQLLRLMLEQNKPLKERYRDWSDEQRWVMAAFISESRKASNDSDMQYGIKTKSLLGLIGILAPHPALKVGAEVANLAVDVLAETSDRRPSGLTSNEVEQLFTTLMATDNPEVLSNIKKISLLKLTEDAKSDLLLRFNTIANEKVQRELGEVLRISKAILQQFGAEREQHLKALMVLKQRIQQRSYNASSSAVHHFPNDLTNLRDTIFVSSQVGSLIATLCGRNDVASAAVQVASASRHILHGIAAIRLKHVMGGVGSVMMGINTIVGLFSRKRNPSKIILKRIEALSKQVDDFQLSMQRDFTNVLTILDGARQERIQYFCKLHGLIRSGQLDNRQQFQKVILQLDLMSSAIAGTSQDVAYLIDRKQQDRQESIYEDTESVYLEVSQALMAEAISVDKYQKLFDKIYISAKKLKSRSDRQEMPVTPLQGLRLLGRDTGLVAFEHNLLAYYSRTLKAEASQQRSPGIVDMRALDVLLQALLSWHECFSGRDPWPLSENNLAQMQEIFNWTSDIVALYGQLNNPQFIQQLLSHYQSAFEQVIFLVEEKLKLDGVHDIQKNLHVLAGIVDSDALAISSVNLQWKVMPNYGLSERYRKNDTDEYFQWPDANDASTVYHDDPSRNQYQVNVPAKAMLNNGPGHQRFPALLTRQITSAVLVTVHRNRIAHSESVSTKRMSVESLQKQKAHCIEAYLTRVKCMHAKQRQQIRAEIEFSDILQYQIRNYTRLKTPVVTQTYTTIIQPLPSDDNLGTITLPVGRHNPFGLASIFLQAELLGLGRIYYRYHYTESDHGRFRLSVFFNDDKLWEHTFKLPLAEHFNTDEYLWNTWVGGDYASGRTILREFSRQKGKREETREYCFEPEILPHEPFLTRHQTTIQSISVVTDQYKAKYHALQQQVREKESSHCRKLREILYSWLCTKGEQANKNLTRLDFLTSMIRILMRFIFRPEEMRSFNLNGLLTSNAIAEKIKLMDEGSLFEQSEQQRLAAFISTLKANQENLNLLRDSINHRLLSEDRDDFSMVHPQFSERHRTLAKILAGRVERSVVSDRLDADVETKSQGAVDALAVDKRAA